MFIFDCKECGGRNEVEVGSTYITCAYCGKQITLPTVKDEDRARLFNRANYFRRQGEFDKAIQAFTGIVNQDASDPEATWGRVLARYGIEYVEDPRTGERIPTCNRVSNASILTDSDYLATLDNSKDEYTRSLYIKEAERIDKIQKGILAIAKLEEPFDVFICYKESTGGGSRTEDSVLAQDIYDKLTKEGMRVFFSRITLEDKLGQQYEPYIFAALNSAKVMLVVTTDPANVNSVWVKNEWSRYLSIMQTNHDKVLIPCYKKMDVYDLPDELNIYQSQDMSRIGAVQDLVHIVKKYINNVSKIQVHNPSFDSPNIESLYRRACLFLEDKNFDRANEYFDRILDIDPECAKAYMGKVFAKEKVCGKEELISRVAGFDDSGDYEKAVRFAKGEEKAQYEEIQKERQYRMIMRDKNWAPGAQHLRRVAVRFRELGEYKDAIQQADECERLASEKEMVQKSKKIEVSRDYVGTTERLAQKYKYGINTLTRAESVEEFNKPASPFDSLGGYMDAPELKQKSIMRAQQEEKRERWKKQGMCQHCGNPFRGLFNKVCRECGKPKDY